MSRGFRRWVCQCRRDDFIFSQLLSERLTPKRALPQPGGFSLLVEFGGLTEFIFLDHLFLLAWKLCRQLTLGKIT